MQQGAVVSKALSRIQSNRQAAVQTGAGRLRVKAPGEVLLGFLRPPFMTAGHFLFFFFFLLIYVCSSDIFFFDSFVPSDSICFCVSLTTSLFQCPFPTLAVFFCRGSLCTSLFLSLVLSLAPASQFHGSVGSTEPTTLPSSGLSRPGSLSPGVASALRPRPGP